MAAAAGPTRVVGVAPPGELAARSRLFSSLERALPIRFAAVAGPASAEVDAVLAFGAEAEADLPAGPRPCLAFALPTACTAAPLLCRLGHSPQLDARLRGHALADDDVPPPRPLPLGPGDVALATAATGPIWVRRQRPPHGRLERVAFDCPELEPDEVLRDRLRAGRFLSLLPLVHFLRELTAQSRLTAPSLRASLMFDDPNLRRPTYGFLRFEELARHVRAHRYHVSLATVPLDGFPLSPTAVRIFRENRDTLSLLVHGVNHEGRELLRPGPPGEVRALLAQGLRRVAAFERRSRIPVARIMAPPHGACSPESMQAMLELGFEAVCTFWAFPQPPGRPPPDWPLSGWDPAQLLAGGMPVVQRWPLVDHPREDLVFRAFLDQPLIVFAHHEDVADGLDPLADAAAFIDGLGKVAWLRADQLCRGNFISRRTGDTLRVKMFARTIDVHVPAGVERLVLELPPTHGTPRRHRLEAQGSRLELELSAEGWVSPALPVAPGPLRLALAPVPSTDPSAVPPPRWRVGPIARRLTTEARDRLRPAITIRPRRHR